jgi:DNA-binding LacI/PurR family transcriptional regulator
MMDVARLAGVSHQTVSRVLNDHPSVRRETRERVLAAMRELDYQPNSAARTLVTNRSQTLGLVTFDTTLVGPSFMVYAVERAAREAGYFVSIASARSLETSSVAEAIRRLREADPAAFLHLVLRTVLPTLRATPPEPAPTVLYRRTGRLTGPRPRTRPAAHAAKPSKPEAYARRLRACNEQTSGRCNRPLLLYARP